MGWVAGCSGAGRVGGGKNLYLGNTVSNHDAHTVANVTPKSVEANPGLHYPIVDALHWWHCHDFGG